MNRFKYILIIFSFILICIASALITCKILLMEFMPVAVCTGDNTYALAERINNKWLVSVFDKNGNLIHDRKFSGKNSDREAMISYLDDTYYFATVGFIDENKSAMNVHKVLSKNGQANDSELKITTQNNEQLFDLHINENVLSIVGTCSSNEKTQLSVYLAGNDSQSFSQSKAYTLSQNYFVRNGYYLSDGSVIFLTAAGRVYKISEINQTPILIYDGSELEISDIFLDEEENICFIDCQGDAYKIIGTGNIEPILKSMISMISYSNPETDLSNFTDISVINENYASVVFQDKNEKWMAAFYQNGMLNSVDNIIHYSWWVFALVFLSILILLSAALFFIATLTWKFLKLNWTLPCRISFVSITAASIVLTIISVDLYKVYASQKEEQNWERLTIMLNNGEVYIEPENQENLVLLSQLDLDENILDLKTNEFLQRLWSFSNYGMSESRSFLIFVGNSLDDLTAISGDSKQIGKKLEQIYDKKTVSLVLNMLNENEKMIYGSFFKCGIPQSFIAKPINLNEAGKGFIIIQTSQKSENELWILAAVLLLCIAVVGFLVILLLRIKWILRPLNLMEERAQQLMLTGNCDSIPVKGHNEITVLTRRFHQAVSEMKISMNRSRQSAESYGRFVDKNWLWIMGKENLSALQVGGATECMLAVLEMNFTPCNTYNDEREQINEYQKLYNDIILIVKNNKGIAECLSHERMRFIFPENSFNAVCTASMIREIVQDKYKLEAVLDYGNHSRIFSQLKNESLNFPLLYSKCKEFGCCILVTGDVIEEISDFQTIFNSRLIGFFSDFLNSTEAVRIVEILPQRCSDTFERGVRLYHVGKYSKAFTLFSSAVERDPDDLAAIRYLYLCDKAMKESETKL